MELLKSQIKDSSYSASVGRLYLVNGDTGKKGRTGGKNEKRERVVLDKNENENKRTRTCSRM
jgi:hypothetical protein